MKNVQEGIHKQKMCKIFCCSPISKCIELPRILDILVKHKVMKGTMFNFPSKQIQTVVEEGQIVLLGNVVYESVENF